MKPYHIETTSNPSAFRVTLLNHKGEQLSLSVTGTLADAERFGHLQAAHYERLRTAVQRAPAPAPTQAQRAVPPKQTPKTASPKPIDVQQLLRDSKALIAQVDREAERKAQHAHDARIGYSPSSAVQTLGGATHRIDGGARVPEPAWLRRSIETPVATRRETAEQIEARRADLDRRMLGKAPPATSAPTVHVIGGPR